MAYLSGLSKKLHLILILCGINFMVQAETGEIIVSVVVSEPPCSIESSPLEFGSVNGGSIDGDNFKQTVEYNIECGGSEEKHDLLMKLTGDSVDFDNSNSTIASDVDGLGVRLFANKKPFVLDEVISFNSLDLPVLQAVPIKKDGVTLPAGEFNASATLTISYP